jgi:sec-independent protein translocase protein TatB
VFDFSFGEVLLVGGVALVVIGPERLPKVARTVGAMVARAQRYVNNVKSDIQREIDLENLRQLEAEMNEAGRKLAGEVGGGMTDLRRDVEGSVHEAHQAFSAPDGTSHSSVGTDHVGAHSAVEGHGDHAAPPPFADATSPVAERPPRDRR